VCDLETSRMGAPYIYDISRLRVNSNFTPDTAEWSTWHRNIQSEITNPRFSNTGF